MRMLCASTFSAVAVERERPDDHFGRADQLPDLDDGRVAERRRQRQVQLLERTHAFVARDRAQAARVQLVGEQHRGRFRQPVQPRLVPRVLERDDEDPAAAGLRGRGPERAAGQRRRRMQTWRWHAATCWHHLPAERSSRRQRGCVDRRRRRLTTTDSRQPLRAAAGPALVDARVGAQRRTAAARARSPRRRSRTAAESTSRAPRRTATRADRSTPSRASAGRSRATRDRCRARARARCASAARVAQRRRQRPNDPALERRQVVDRPVRGVLAGARGDQMCRPPLRCAESSAPRTAAPGRSCLRASPATFSQFS